MSEVLIALGILIVLWCLGYWLRDLETTITVGPLNLGDGDCLLVNGEVFRVTFPSTVTANTCITYRY